MTQESPREVEIEKIVEGGFGLARDAGRAVLIPLTAPGDVVLYLPEGGARGRTQGRLVEVLRPSPLRAAAPCPHYGTCGGCQSQHLTAAAQLAVKAAAARESLRFSRLALPDPIPLAPSPRPFGYRHRATLSLAKGPRGPVSGFYRFRSHEVVPFAACPILSDAANAAVAAARERLLPLVAGRLPDAMEVVATDDGRAEVAFASASAPDAATASRLAAAAADWPALRALYWETDGPRFRTLHERGPALTYEIPSAAGPPIDVSFDLRAFTQANLAANRLLVEALIEETAACRGMRLLDLYAGCGNLTLPLVSRAEAAHLVEVNPIALAHAEHSAAGRVARLDLSAERAGDFVRRSPVLALRPDVVILDPPREGAAEVLGALLDAGPERILYVSCNMPTLGRDLATLTPSRFRLDSLRLFDFYPQTAHVEALAVLRRV